MQEAGNEMKSETASGLNVFPMGCLKKLVGQCRNG